MGLRVRRCPGFGPQQVLLLEEKKESGNTCLDRGLPANISESRSIPGHLLFRGDRGFVESKAPTDKLLPGCRVPLDVGLPGRRRFLVKDRNRSKFSRNWELIILGLGEIDNF